MTVTGRTLGENLEEWTHRYGELDSQQDVIRPLNKPIKETGHIRLVSSIVCLQDSAGLLMHTEFSQNPQRQSCSWRRSG